ncbi:TetR/AcrR family transcriptional regulator [Gordonia sp. UCD-TK1]|uniref:TetR/AcrR family transcriptional regulator n=1 Tax=Gordonia sp. UCD-TK1 TaxID=1857893 RepID=UPI00080E62B0|nr:TetR/AcrR family transcriptional regulator [Gordonia sp. UCD-TK1]OCH80657.1 TetR family transcriptional regulator [Gordonia sp. UCD-TK1]
MQKPACPIRRRTAPEVRESLLVAAVAELDEAGPENASLRAIARRVGITHQSVAHHFADRRALFTAVAVRGFDNLHTEHMRALEQLPDDAPLGEAVATLGQVYVRFARDNRATVTLMMGSRLVDNKAPDLIAARARGWELHTRTVSDAADHGWGGGVPGNLIAVATFAMAHGLAALETDFADQLPDGTGIEDLLSLVNAAIITPPHQDS